MLLINRKKNCCLPRYLQDAFHELPVIKLLENQNILLGIIRKI